AAAAAQAARLRPRPDAAKEPGRRVQGVAHGRAVLAWAAAVPAPDVFRRPPPAAPAPRRPALASAPKGRADPAAAAAGGPARRGPDGAARRGLHGGAGDGSGRHGVLGADSERRTAMHVVPGNGADGAPAAALRRPEERARPSAGAAVALDGTGYGGPVRRAWTEPAGRHPAGFPPPPAGPAQSARGPGGQPMADPST